MTIDPDYKIDMRQIHYNEPKTNVSWLVQQAEYRINGQALANAIMAGWRDARKQKDKS